MRYVLSLRVLVTVFLVMATAGCEEIGTPITDLSMQSGPGPTLPSLPGTGPISGPVIPGMGGGTGTDPGGDDDSSGESGTIGNPGNPGGGDGGQVGGFITDSFTQTQFTQRYDFLWVIDNSGSMSNIRTFMSQNLTGFVNTLEARRSLDWQMAVTITDNFVQAGNLIAASDGTRVVRRSTPGAASVWASLIGNIRDTARSGWEQGLESGRSAIERYGNEFSRAGVPLIVTYISDEQDYSCESGCNYSGAPETNFGAWTMFPVSRYVDQLNALKARNEANVIVYPIVHKLPLGGSNPCDDTVGSQGGRYMSVQSQVGTGQSMSICRDEIAASFQQVAELTSNLGVCFTLNHRLATTDGMQVRVDGSQVMPSSTQGYVYEAAQNAVCFSGSLIPQNGAQVSVYYRAL